MVERVKVTDPDGEPENTCVKDLSGLYGCLIAEHSKTRGLILINSPMKQLRNSRDVGAQHFFDNFDFDEKINCCGARTGSTKSTTSGALGFDSHL
jgi:hypothetical protein